MPMSRAVSSAWIRTPSSKLRLNRSRNATAMVPPGLDRAHQLPPARAIHGAAAGHVGENQVLAYAVVRIRTSPRARLGWQRGCPTGCASWKSQGKTCGIAEQTMEDGAGRNNPMPINSVEQVLEVLEKAW